MNRISKLEETVDKIASEAWLAICDLEKKVRELKIATEKSAKCRKVGHDFDAAQVLPTGSMLELPVGGTWTTRAIPIRRRTCKRCGFRDDKTISNELFKKLTK